MKIYLVTATWNGMKYFLRNTIWTTERRRADQFVCQDNAIRAQIAARKYKPAAFNKIVTIEQDDHQ